MADERPKVDHDQKLKAALKEFWWEALESFEPRLASRSKRETCEWQPQEVFTNPPSGLVRRVDLLALVELRGEAFEQRLIDFEVESSESLGEARKKLAYYYPALRTQTSKGVTLLAFYLRVGLDGQGWDEYAESPDGEEAGEPVYRVRWRYVGLPALPAEQYLQGGSWLGVGLSCLMRIDKGGEARHRAEFLRRLATECRESDYRKLLLIDLLDTYLPLEGDLLSAYDKLVASEPRYRENQDVIKTTFDKGYDKGYDKGVEDSQALVKTTFDKGYDTGYDTGKLEVLRETVLDLAAGRCGPAGEAVKQRLGAIDDLARLRALCRAAPSAATWDELLG